MADETPTLEEIQATIRAARDSVWVIDQMVEQLDAGEEANTERKGNLDRNVEHLKIITTRDEIVNSGEDISDLLAGITKGEAELAKHTWPAEEE